MWSSKYISESNKKKQFAIISTLPSQYEQSPLYAACFGGHTETTQFLIDEGADVNTCEQVSTVVIL